MKRGMPTANVWLGLLIALCGGACGSAVIQDQGSAPAPTATSAATSDTVRVPAPTDDPATDRANIQAAFDAVQPGGTILFAPGTYRLGAGAQLTVPDVTVLGHPEGTVLRGCDPEAFEVEASRIDTVVFGCTGLYVQAERQTIRGLTFEYTWHGIVVGPYPTSVAEPEVGEGEDFLPASYPAGGQRIEGNTFRAVPNGIRVLGHGEDLSVVRDNDFIDVFHAIGIYGAPLHFVDNRVTVVDPGRVPYSRHPGSAIIVSPGHTDCAGHVVAGNRVDGYPDPIYVLVGRGETCRGVEIRDNTVRAARVKVPEAWEGYEPTDADSTMVGAPITLMNITEPVPGMPEADTEGVLEDIIVEGNRILGAEGVGILLQNVSRSRVVGNTVTGVERRDPFPGLTWDGFDQRWAAANGSGIWLSPGSEGNEIVGNTFDDIAAADVFVERDRNVVEVPDATGAVRDLGAGNRVARNVASQRWTDPSPHSVRYVVVAPGVRLEVLDWGGNGPALVFLAGLSMNAHAFDAFAPRFTDTYRVIGITRRGHGSSSWPAEGYSLERRVEDIRITLDSLGLERVILAGHSLAGGEMTAFASTVPERAAGLIYIDAAHDLSQIAPLRLTELCPGGPEVIEAMERRFEAPEEFRRTQRQWAADGTMRPFASDAAVAQLIEGFSSPDYTEVRTPALAVYHTPRRIEDAFGGEATLSPACVTAMQRYIYEGIASFAAGMDSGRIVGLDDSQHNIHLVSPDALEDAMRRWMTEFLHQLEPAHHHEE